MSRVPVDQIAEIGAVVKLKCKAETLGLHKVEDKVAAWIPRKAAF